jgi:hypothetical protein
LLGQVGQADRKAALSTSVKSAIQFGDNPEILAGDNLSG